MTRERSLDLFVMALNVAAIVLLAGILSATVTTADANASLPPAAADSPAAPLAKRQGKRRPGRRYRAPCCSRDSSFSLTASPPPNPTSLPVTPITR